MPACARVCAPVCVCPGAHVCNTRLCVRSPGPERSIRSDSGGVAFPGSIQCRDSPLTNSQFSVFSMHALHNCLVHRGAPDDGQHNLFAHVVAIIPVQQLSTCASACARDVVATSNGIGRGAMLRIPTHGGEVGGVGAASLYSLQLPRPQAHAPTHSMACTGFAFTSISSGLKSFTRVIYFRGFSGSCA